MQCEILPGSTPPGPVRVPRTEEALNTCTKPQMRNSKGSSRAFKKVLTGDKLVILLVQPLYSHGLPEMRHHLDKSAVEVDILQLPLKYNLISN